MLGVQNSRSAPLVVIVEPWAHDFTLFPGEKIVVVAFGSTASPRFDVVERDGFCEVYCDGASNFRVTQSDRELECGHQRQT